MLRPAMSQILREGESYYAFVVAVAHKAREIAEEADEKKYALGCKTGELSPGGVCLRQGSGKGYSKNEGCK